jgi:hypothetical protein
MWNVELGCNPVRSVPARRGTSALPRSVNTETLSSSALWASAIRRAWLDRKSYPEKRAVLLCNVVLGREQNFVNRAIVARYKMPPDSRSDAFVLNSSITSKRSRDAADPLRPPACRRKGLLKPYATRYRRAKRLAPCPRGMRCEWVNGASHDEVDFTTNQPTGKSTYPDPRASTTKSIQELSHLPDGF